MGGVFRGGRSYSVNAAMVRDILDASLNPASQTFVSILSGFQEWRGRCPTLQSYSDFIFLQ